MNLEDIKDYLRVLHPDEDVQIQSMLDASIAYITNAVDNYTDKYARSDDFRHTADMVVKIIVSELYDNRQYVANDKYKNASQIVTSLITQLQLGDYDED